MNTRGSSLQSRGLRDLHCLHHGLFQTSTDRAQLRAAVYQVFGSQQWGGCCSNNMLETLLEAGQRSYLKQQLYWDFQLLDSDHDGYLSVKDAELLLAQVPRAYATGEAWQDFLRSRGPGVAWRDIEDWLFRAIQLPIDEPRPGQRRGLHNELGTNSGSSTSLYQWGVRNRPEQPLERWDSGGLATLLGEEPSGVLAALEWKYRVLQRKLCAEMLQVHYGQPVWASLAQNMKEDKLSELELLVDCGLRKGSILPLACLPGAQLSVRSGVQMLESDRSVQCVSPAVTQGTAAEALQELRRRRQVETTALLAQQHLLVGSNPEASRRLLYLHAQTVLLQQEASFQAALLVTELFQGERFWDSLPIIPEACHRELAQLRLAAGRGWEPAWQEAKAMPGRSMTQVLLDRLLLQHERDRACLVQILLTLAGTEAVQDEAQGGKQLILPGAGSRDDHPPALQETIAQRLKLAQKRLQATKTVVVTGQDCAVAVLVDLQQAQEEELQRTIEDLVGIVSGWEGDACPTLYEKLLARLQEPLLMSLTRQLQPGPSQEEHARESLKVGLGMSAQDPSSGELDVSTAQMMLQKEDGSGAPQKQSHVESQGPLLKKLKTSEHQDGEKDSEALQNSVAPQMDQNLTEDQEMQQRSLDTALLQIKSKSWGPPEFVRPQVLLPKQLRRPEIPPLIPQGISGLHNLGGQCREEAVALQAQNDPRCIVEGDIQSDALRKETDIQPQSSPKGKKVPFRTQKQEYPEKQEAPQAAALSACQTSHPQKQRDPEFSHLQEALMVKSKSLDPQELSRPWSNEHRGPIQREEDVSGPQDCKFPKDCQPERCEQTKVQEPLEHTECPGSEPKAVQIPKLLGKEPEASMMAKRQDRQKPDAPQKKVQVSCPEELRNTKACQTDTCPFQAQEKLPRNWSRPQGPKPCKKAMKEPEAQVPLLRKTKSLKSKEMSKTKGINIPLENIHTQGVPEGKEPGPCQASVQGKRSLGTIQERRESELPQTQNLLHNESEKRKSKSLELRKPPASQSQKVKVPCKQGGTQMGPWALEPQEWKQAGDFQSQKQRQEPQSRQPEEFRQKQEPAQEGPQTTKVRQDFLPEEETQAELPPSQEAQRKKSKPPDARESHKRKDPETVQNQGTAPQREKGVLQIQECGRPESRPLLWRVLWQKAKSFDVGKPYDFPIQKLRKLEEALSQGMPQKMKELPMLQPQIELQIHKLQEDKRPESPPLLWRILWQKSKSFEVRKSCALETQELKGSLILHVHGGSQIEPEAYKPQEPKILTQRTRKVETPQAQETPQLNTRALEETQRLKGAGADVQEWQDSQALLSETLATQRVSERDHPPQESRYSETPPLLWRVLGMKAKSFELRRPNPRAFRTQQARNPGPAFLAAQEMRRLAMIQQQGELHVQPGSHKQGGPNLCSPQGPRDLEMTKAQSGPQRHQTVSESGKVLHQGTGAPQMETHPERRSPETPPLMWWVLEMDRQGMLHRKLKEVESVPMQGSVQRQMDPQNTSPGEQNTLRPNNRKDLETSMTQEKVTENCNSYEARRSDVSHGQGQVISENPQPMKAQGTLQCNPEGFNCSGLLKGGKTRKANCPAHETLGHMDSLLSPGRLLGKSKSLDLRELQPPKPPELRELESPEAQGRPNTFQDQDDLQMKLAKLQQPKAPQALKAQERSDLESSEAHSTQPLLQPQGRGAEIPPPLQGHLQPKTAQRMEPHLLQTQELVVLHLQGTLQMNPETLTFQRHIDPKSPSPQGQSKAGSSGCEFQMEEKPSEMQGSLQKHPQDYLMHATEQPEATPVRNSAPFSPQELSKPCFFETQKKTTHLPGCPQAPEVHALKGLETFAPHVTTEVVANPLLGTSELKTKHESPVQRELSDQEISRPQEKTEENEAGAPDSQGYADINIHQLQEKKETEVLSFGPTDPHDLQFEETLPWQPDTLEAVEHGKPSTWLSPGYSELWEFWRTLGKSKSLDVRGLRDLQLEALSELEFSRLQNISRTWQSQRRLQNDPLDLHSKFLQIHELILKDQVAPQPQERGGCEVQGPQQMGPEPLQEALSGKGEIPSSQELDDAQIFCPELCGVTQAGGEPLQALKAAEKQPEAVEPQGRMEPKLLTTQEKRNIESPPLLKGLLRKSKTLGVEMLTRRDDFHVQDVRKTESPPGLGSLRTHLQGQESHNIHGLGKELQEMLNKVEGTVKSPIPEKIESPREACTMETAATEAQEPLHVDKDTSLEQGDASFMDPEQLQALPPTHQVPLFGNKLLKELGTLHTEPETIGLQGWKGQEAIHPKGSQEFFEAVGQVAVEPPALDPQVPQHPERQITESRQPPLVGQKISEAPGPWHGPEENRGPCQSPGRSSRESDSRGSPALKAPHTFPLQESLPEISPVMAVGRGSHPLHCQEFRDPAIYCPLESPEVGWELLGAEGKDSGPSELQEHPTLELQGALPWKSKSLNPQELSKTWDFQGWRGADDLHAQHGELEKETPASRNLPAVTAFSPPSPGGHEKEVMWKPPAALSVGLSREGSIWEAQPGPPSKLSRHPQEEDTPPEGEGATVPTLPENQQARTWQLLSPRPPHREKAFIWLSRQEQEEALRQLAELRAEGELRHRRDKERQALRFQERLSIAKHRKSEDDLLGSSSADRWPLAAEHQGQDQAGQKTAVKQHLEKVKRERTYVMQSKRERNTLSFKELLNPLVAAGEESPEPGQPGGGE